MVLGVRTGKVNDGFVYSMCGFWKRKKISVSDEGLFHVPRSTAWRPGRRLSFLFTTFVFNAAIPSHTLSQFFFFSLSPSFHFSHSFFVLYFAGVLPLIFISSLSLLYFLCSPDSMPCHGDPADVTVEYHTILE
jgi:hypothetical protein